ncbi:oligosaccharide flippase family protein [Bacillus cereus group sp. BfR-BA-00331]|uniref:oligosaccharide flippase family protein n=1 Tax=Bacillus cereus group sp. BfR-BA-00331 TaxID=3094866 RepID=UPI0029C542EA|nr:oligosaccharide flippase family protein [Bacillus cereus group sp. BfR-BA-00331]MDX5959078.1 oligosaccharide flippase family protein [Bacillus cereus group sp. BfR-BA-00331]
MGKLVSNYLFTVTYQLLLMITPFITTPYVSRVLKPQGIGIDAYVMSVVQLFLVFAILSIPLYGSRQVATKENITETSKEFWSIYIIQIIVSLFTCIMYFLFISVTTDYKELFFIHIFSLVAAAIDISWYFIGKEQIKKITIRNILIRLLGIFLVFALVKDYNDLSLYIIINTTTLFAGQLIMWIPLLKEIRYVKITFLNIKPHILPIITLFIPQLLIQVYVLANKVVLGNISGETEVGYYNQANKIIKLALGVITSLGTVLLPRMALEFSKGNISQIKMYTKYTLQFVLMITLPMTFGMMSIAPNFVNCFFGEGYSEVATLIILMSPVILFVGLANIFGLQILIPTNQSNKYSIAVTVGAVLSLIVNLILVPSYGGIGTVVALLVAEVIGALILMFYAREYFIMSYFMKLFCRYFVLSIGVYILVILIGNIMSCSPLLITVIQLLVGGAFYLAGLLIIRDSMIGKLVNVINSKLVKRGK